MVGTGMLLLLEQDNFDLQDLNTQEKTVMLLINHLNLEGQSEKGSKRKNS